MRKFDVLLKLFCTFFKIGAFTFGGGYAMIPLIQREAVEKNQWISDEDILEVVAIAESTPGPIAINSATFVGYRAAGFMGSLFATVGMVLPSFVIIALLSKVIDQFQNARIVKYAFYGIRAGVLALIFRALVNIFKKSRKGKLSLLISCMVFVLVTVVKLNVIAVIILSALIGLFSSMYMERRHKA